MAKAFAACCAAVRRRVVGSCSQTMQLREIKWSLALAAGSIAGCAASLQVNSALLDRVIGRKMSELPADVKSRISSMLNYVDQESRGLLGREIRCIVRHVLVEHRLEWHPNWIQLRQLISIASPNGKLRNFVNRARCHWSQ